jgi:hypothetical protein
VSRASTQRTRLTRFTRFTLAALVAAGATLATTDAGAEFREAGAFTVNFRGGGQLRRDKGYGDAADAFGYGRIAQGGGGNLELYVEPFKRLSFGLSFGGYSAKATRTTTTLTLSSAAWLAHARFAVWRQVFKVRGSQFLVQLEADGAGGVYSMKRTLEDGTLYPTSLATSTRSGGVRVGLDISAYWHAIGLVAGYGYAYAPAAVHDHLGNEIQAGGHEFTGALSLRW